MQLWPHFWKLHPALTTLHGVQRHFKKSTSQPCQDALSASCVLHCFSKPTGCRRPSLFLVSGAASTRSNAASPNRKWGLGPDEDEGGNAVVIDAEKSISFFRFPLSVFIVHAEDDLTKISFSGSSLDNATWTLSSNETWCTKVPSSFFLPCHNVYTCSFDKTSLSRACLLQTALPIFACDLCTNFADT